MKSALLYCLDMGGSTIDMVVFSAEKKDVYSGASLESQDFASQKGGEGLENILCSFGYTEGVMQQKCLYVTGGHSRFFPEYFYLEGEKIVLVKISEFEALAQGGMFLSGKNSGLVVSLGTGTAMISVTDIQNNEWEHVRGTGIGGGTLLGLSRATLGIDAFSDFQKISDSGDLSRVDISVEEMIGGSLGNLTPEMTASNFGRFSSENSRESDIALGIANLVGQSIASLAIEKARFYNHDVVILGGKLSRLSVVVECIQKTAALLGIEIVIPPSSGVMTAIGVGMSAVQKSDIKA